jgi:hypothetical protein
MKQMEEILKRWAAVAPVRVALKELATDDALQPRSLESVALGNVQSERKRMEDHIRVIANRLKAPAVDVEPILVARTSESLCIVDGHHRFYACRAAERADVPARVIDLPMDQAVLASKFVNFGAEKMTMHPEQRRDAAWQWLSSATARGTQPLPEGASQRKVAARFDISLGNVSNMMGVLSSGRLDPSRFKESHVDPGTRWLRWRFARNPHYGDEWTPTSPGERIEKEGNKLAVKIAEAIQRFGPEVFRCAVAHLQAEGIDAEAIEDANEFLAIMEDPDSDF